MTTPTKPITTELIRQLYEQTRPANWVPWRDLLTSERKSYEQFVAGITAEMVPASEHARLAERFDDEFTAVFVALGKWAQRTHMGDVCMPQPMHDGTVRMYASVTGKTPVLAQSASVFQAAKALCEQLNILPTPPASAPTEGKAGQLRSAYTDEEWIAVQESLLAQYQEQATQAEARVLQLDKALTELASFLAEHDGTPSADPCAEAIRIMQLQAASAVEANKRIAEYKASEADWREAERTLTAELEEVRDCAQRASVSAAEAMDRLAEQLKAAQLELNEHKLFANRVRECWSNLSPPIRVALNMLDCCITSPRVPESNEAKAGDCPECDGTGSVVPGSGCGACGGTGVAPAPAQPEAKPIATSPIPAVAQRSAEAWAPRDGERVRRKRNGDLGTVVLSMVRVQLDAGQLLDFYAEDLEPVTPPAPPAEATQPLGYYGPVELEPHRCGWRNSSHERCALAYPHTGAHAPSGAAEATQPEAELCSRCKCKYLAGSSCSASGYSLLCNPPGRLLKSEPLAEAFVSRAELVAALRACRNHDADRLFTSLAEVLECEQLSKGAR